MLNTGKEEMTNGNSHNALVLAGGGARGAYEAGVTKYIMEVLSVSGETHPRFDMFCGTSIGALNSCFLASGADDPVSASKQLVSYWRSITLDKILRFGLPELHAAKNIILGKKPGKGLFQPKGGRQAHSHHPPIQGLFNTDPLYDEMSRLIPWNKIGENIERGDLVGLALSATELCRGKTAVFYQMGEHRFIQPSQDPSKETKRVKIQVDHAMASSAIPFIFPSVQIDGFCYVDGALRQNTPIYPAMRMGAKKILVVSLSEAPAQAFLQARSGCQRNPNPGLFFLLGRMINTLLTESLDYELKRIEMFNTIITSGQQRYGPSFLEEINSLTQTYRNSAYRVVSTCMIRPSIDLNKLAIEVVKKNPHELALPGLSGKIFQKIMLSSFFQESELLSYLMFTPSYIEKLIELGFNDAKRMKSTLIRFFSESH